MTDYLKVPFGYEAEVLPSRRHKKTHSIWLRSEILVEVPSLSRQEVVQALALPEVYFVSGWEVQAHGDRSLLCFEGRLYGQLRVGGAPVDLRGAAEAFSETIAAGSKRESPVNLSYPEQTQYPIAMEAVWNFRKTPLMVRSLSAHGRSEGWPAPLIVSSTLHDQELQAAKRLAAAFLLIDGVVYMERPEPVLHLRRVRRNVHRLVVETYPWTEGAEDFFRLDRTREARAWAASRRLQLKSEPWDEAAEVFWPEMLERQDAVEVAKHALAVWSHLRDEIKESAHRDRRQVELLNQLLDAGGNVDLDAAARVMEALRDLERLAGNAVCWRPARRLDARWRAERYVAEPDLFSDNTHDLTADDLLALEEVHL